MEGVLILWAGPSSWASVNWWGTIDPEPKTRRKESLSLKTLCQHPHLNWRQSGFYDQKRQEEHFALTAREHQPSVLREEGKGLWVWLQEKQ